MVLGEVVYFSRRSKIVSLNVVPHPVSKKRNQGYNACIHACWAMTKDTWYHII